MDDALVNMVKNLEAKTGKTAAEWVAVVRGMGARKHSELVAALKGDHGLGHGYANMVVHLAKGDIGENAPPADDLVAAQYAGDKAALRPMYETLVAAIAGFGPDVEFSPKKAYVSVRRSKQFALLQPSTKTRLDVGLNLKGVAPEGPLEASGSFNSMCTHRVRLEAAADITPALIAWLRQAYERA